MAPPPRGGGPPPARAPEFPDLIGRSQALRDVQEMVQRAAGVDASVLITGESGTGKEVVARSLHGHSGRSDRPFVAVNCTAIPEGLLESELFGHVRGAFTGATDTRSGLFEQARGGTLFLDEVGDMRAKLQAKLLRALQEREIRPVGSTVSVKVDVRIIAATHRDLDVEMQTGRFREDLYYRLNVIPIHLPPLRNRPEDIPLLIEAFLRRHDRGGRRHFSPAAVERLQACPWRGNGRELENFVERTLALTDPKTIDVSHLDFGSEPEPQESWLVLGLAEAARAGLPLREIVDLYIDEMLAATKGMKGEAAKRLGIDRKTLYRRHSRRDA